MIIFSFAPAKKPLLNMWKQERGFQNGEDIKNLNLHTARYCYYMQHIYMQLVTPSDAATAVTIDNKI